MVAACVAFTAEVATVVCAEALPSGMAISGVTCAAELLLRNPTTKPPARATPLSPTVRVALSPAFRKVGDSVSVANPQSARRQQIHLERDHVGGVAIGDEGKRYRARAVEIGRQQQVDLIQAEKARGRAGVFHRERIAVARRILRQRGHGIGVAQTGAVDGEPCARIVSVVRGLHHEGRGAVGHRIEDRAGTGAAGVAGEHTGAAARTSAVPLCVDPNTVERISTVAVPAVSPPGTTRLIWPGAT